MYELILSLFAGFVVGVLFSVLKLPIPAPPVLSGVLGIVGVYLGGVAYLWIIEKFFSG
ncbi:XapX domain-containing protein [Thalassotalea aquiviva]|uniref:XapX domain-containing protein n=1 Tax=Thalassotalea aquiviva TaxID=3242415 RepID=UPI00352B6391